MRRALAPEDDSIYTGFGWTYAYSWALDRGEVAAAGGYLDHVLGASAAAVGFRRAAPLIPLEAAFFFARHRRDLVATREWLAKDTAGAPFAAFMRARAEAAILLAEGDASGALARVEAGLEALARVQDELDRIGADAETEGEDLRVMAAEARAAVGIPVPPSLHPS